MELAEGVDLQLCEELGEDILVLGMPTDGVQIKFSLEYACYKHSKKKWVASEQPSGVSYQSSTYSNSSIRRKAYWAGLGAM